MMEKIYLVNYNSSWGNYAKELIEDAFQTKVIPKVLEIPINAFNSVRNQYSAELLLDYALEKYTDALVFAIIDEDIYVPGFNFVFGLAYPFRGAIVSTYRLQNFERVKKEILHEMGHLLGLEHCSNYCVMQFSNSVYEVDQKPDKYCIDCYNKLLTLGWNINPKYVIK